MSLLGKKRTKRDEEDEKVRYNHIILKNSYKKEYEQMMGIKGEEPKKEETNNIENKTNNILTQEEKIENKDVKIIEININLPNKERIKAKTYKKEKPIISLFPINKEKNNKNKNDKKEEKNDEPKNDKNDNIFNTKPMQNPFLLSLQKDNKEKSNNNSDKKVSLFGNISKINKKDEIKEEKSQISDENKKKEDKKANPQMSLFGINNNKDEKKENPQTLLFENKNDSKGNKNKSLFGNIFSSNNNKSLFQTDNNNSSLFSGNNNISLFSGNNNKSLFSENKNNETNNNNSSLFFGNNNNKPLFSNSINSNNKDNPLFSNNINISNPFSQIKGDLFLKSISNENNNDNIKNKNESLFSNNSNNEDNEEDDERDKPKTKYVAEPLKAQDYSNYSKIYNTHLNNLFLFNKTEKKFISKGNGFFSIEKTKDEKSQHQVVIVFRNQTGNKLVEGFVDKKFNKFDIINKDFNYVVSFGIIMINEGKLELGYIKIPFKNEENANELKEAFGKAILFLEGK